MKKKLSLLLVVIVIISSVLVGCGGEKADNQTSNSQETTENSTPDKVYVLKLAYSNAEADPMTKALYEMEKQVEARTNGAIDIEVYHSGQLGSTADTIEQVQAGGNVGCLTDAARISGTVPEIMAINAPYMFSSYEEGIEVIESEVFQDMFTDLKKDTDIEVLAFNWWQGARNVISKNPINSIEDMKNVRLRSPGDEMYNVLIESWGGKPAGLAWGEIYSGLQQKVIDGAEGQIGGINSSQLYEVAGNLAMTGHIHLFTGLIVNEQWFAELPEEYQTILREESVNAGNFGSKIVQDNEGAMLQEMIDYGMNVTEPDLTPFKEGAKDVYEKIPAVKSAKEKVDAYLMSK